MNDYEAFKIMRPLLKEHEYDKYKFPIIKKDSFSEDDLLNLKVTNCTNAKRCKRKDETLVLAFHFDSELDKLYNDPRKSYNLFKDFYAVATLDFSAYPNMNENDIRHNVYKNRWFGCFLQDYGIKVIPSITWSESIYYDICFSGVEEGSVVCISTLGCHNDKAKPLFLEGFNEMKRVIKPSLIIVFGGKLVEGMTGRFIVFDYSDTFIYGAKSYEKISLFDRNQIIEVRD